MPVKKKIVIAGAGFAGVRAALDLTRLLPNQQITIIDNQNSHCFHADLYEVGTAVLPIETKGAFRSLAGTVSIPLKRIFSNKQVEIITAKIEKIDLPSKQIKTLKEIIEYDFLVLALGSSTNYFGIEGSEQYSHPFKNTEDALNVRDDIEELISQSDKEVKIVVAGGGFTGVELVGELTGYLKKLANTLGKPEAKVIILEAGSSLLAGMPAWAQEAALSRLKSLGVNIVFNNPIIKVSSHEIFSEGQAALSYDYLVWTTGVRGTSLDEGIIGVELTKRGKLITEKDLSLATYPNVFVAGDLAECMDEKRNCPLEATARIAIKEGELSARNIKARVLGVKTENFNSPPSFFVVPVGGKYAISNLGKMNLMGWTGWLLKRLISLKYLWSILTPYEALTVWFKGVRIYTSND